MIVVEAMAGAGMDMGMDMGQMVGAAGVGGWLQQQQQQQQQSSSGRRGGAAGDPGLHRDDPSSSNAGDR